ncbi:MAG: hypothetical protein ACE5Z5_04695 [Candidatus Bathyarchaeia archaeon]
MGVVMESRLAEIGEEVYEENRIEWERAYLGRVIAIEVESKRLASVGESLDEAYENALRKYPGKQFYFRKVGPCAATDYLF